MYVETDGDYDYDETVATLSRIFGIVGICPVELHEDEGFDKLCEAVIDHINHVYSGFSRAEGLKEAYLQEEPNQVVVDYIASMTDGYFCELTSKLFPGLKFPHRTYINER